MYWLIDSYLDDDIDDLIYCDEFYYCYCLELNKEKLNEIEKEVFFSLNQVVSRFSEYTGDHALVPNAFYTSTELKRKSIETKEKLGMYGLSI